MKEFDGTLIFVSHDRYFLSALAGAIAEIEDGKLRYFAGGYEAYAAEKKPSPPPVRKTEKAYRSKKERAEEERQKQLVKNLEAQIAECEKREEEINNLLAQPEIIADYVRVNALLKELEAIKLQTDGLYKAYEDML